MSAQVRLRRQAEERILGPVYGKPIGWGETSVIVINYLNDDVLWGINKRVYDTAMLPLREEYLT